MPDDEHDAGTPAYEVRTKVWLERDGAVVISDFLAELLEAVRIHGSVAAAAEALGLPYRTAWKKLREMEAAAGVTLIESTSGGSGGGQTSLSADAARLIEALHRISDPTTTIAQERFDAELRALTDPRAHDEPSCPHHSSP
jgi:molybdate transport system regulatory protein